MTVRYDPAFLKKLKKLDVRVRKSFRERIALFARDPQNPQLNNHSLREKYFGYRSIDITSDYRAIYKEAHFGDDVVAYFIALGTHKELYKET